MWQAETVDLPTIDRELGREDEHHENEPGDEDGRAQCDRDPLPGFCRCGGSGRTRPAGVD